MQYDGHQFRRQVPNHNQKEEEARIGILTPRTRTFGAALGVVHSLLSVDVDGPTLRFRLTVCTRYFFVDSLNSPYVLVSLRSSRRLLPSLFSPSHFLVLTLVLCKYIVEDIFRLRYTYMLAVAFLYIENQIFSSHMPIPSSSHFSRAPIHLVQKGWLGNIITRSPLKHHSRD